MQSSQKLARFLGLLVGLTVLIGSVPLVPARTTWASECKASWQVVTAPNPNTYYNFLKDISGSAGNDIWAVGGFGSTGGAAVLHWDGTAWTEFPDADFEHFSEFLSDVQVVSQEDAWAVGGYDLESGGKYFPFIERWDGTKWNYMPNSAFEGNEPLYGTLLGLAVIDPNNIWAVGAELKGDRSAPLLLQWNGATWSQVPGAKSASLKGNLQAVDGTSPQNIWAVGERGASPNSKTLVQHWDGNKWKIVPSPSPGLNSNELEDVAVLSATDAWAVGQIDEFSSARTMRSLILHWDGESWQSVPHPQLGPNPQRLTGIVALSESNIWAVGSYARSPSPFDPAMLIMHWNGAEWNVVPITGDTRGGLWGVAAIGKNNVWTVGTIPTLPSPYLNTMARYTGWTTYPVLIGPEAHAKVQTRRVKLKWESDPCATYYKVWVRAGNYDGPIVFENDQLQDTRVNTPKLTRGSKYWWQVVACNREGCSLPVSRTFRIKK